MRSPADCWHWNCAPANASLPGYDSIEDDAWPVPVGARPRFVLPDEERSAVSSAEQQQQQQQQQQPDVVGRWHSIFKARDVAALREWLAGDSVFHSPVVHSPQVGRDKVCAYLGAAFEVLGNASFRYVRQIVGERDALLEFQTELDGLEVNGVDLIHWNADGKVVDFKVMIRPLKAIDAVHRHMAAALQAAATRK